MTTDMIQAYDVTLLSWAALATLLITQVIIADVVGIRARHVPGTPVAPDHGDLLFRASRAVANTNESIAIYLVLVLLCVLGGADTFYTGVLSWAYVLGRAAYALCYYFNLQLMRSVCFGLTLVVLIALLVNGIMTRPVG